MSSMAEPRFVKDIMTTGVISIKPTDSVQKAVDIMTERNISCIVVVGEDTRRPLGIVTERDIVRRVTKPGKMAKHIKANSIMTTSLVTISEDASLEEGMRLIEGMHIRRLPVVNADGLVGLVTQTDIVKHTYNIHMHNKKLAFHQNLQSYVIIGLATLFVLIFLFRFYF